LRPTSLGYCPKIRGGYKEHTFSLISFFLKIKSATLRKEWKWRKKEYKFCLIFKCQFYKSKKTIGQVDILVMGVVYGSNGRDMRMMEEEEEGS
jgi:hypothetical protein